MKSRSQLAGQSLEPGSGGELETGNGKLLSVSL
jgi:hypothetical protein